MANGKVWLVGAGPSDSGLLTIKGKRVLEQAEVVIYDRLVSQSILCLIPPSAKKVPVGKYVRYHPVPQEKINQMLVKEALSGKRVVRLKGGDPFLFGRGGEELEALKEEQIPYEIVPGVSSAFAAPAYAGIPVTHREYSSAVHIITGHTKNGELTGIDYRQLAQLDGTLVFLMGMGHIEEICHGLVEAGMAPETPAAVIENGSSPSQREMISTLYFLPLEAKEESFAPPSVIVVGTVCKLGRQFRWNNTRPLWNRRVIVLRPKDRGNELESKLLNLGAEVLPLPSIETVPIDPNPELDEAIDRIHEYEWIVFTSVTGVDVFFDALWKKEVDIRKLGHIKFAAIGTATKERIQSRGIFVSYMPDEYSGKALGHGLAELVGIQEKVLIPRSKIGTEELTVALDKAVIVYDDIATYNTNYLYQQEIQLTEQDVVAFTSTSTVVGFAKAMPDIDFSSVNALCIGEQTAMQARAYGMRTITALEATIDNMIETLVTWNQGGQ